MTLTNVPRDLWAPARLTLLVAGGLAEAAAPVDGSVPGGMAALVDAVGRHRRSVYRAVDELEARHLMRRNGYTRRQRLLVVELVTRPPQAVGSGGTRPSGASRQDPAVRALIAKLGGYERSNREIQAQRDAAKAEAAELRRGRRLDANANLVGLIADLTHAADCPVASCARCIEIGRRTEAKRAEYLPEAELVERLEHGAAVVAAATEAVAALRDTGVGSMARRAAALRALAAALGAS